MLLLLPASAQQRDRQLKPILAAPIDCGFGQPCTGTRCVNQQLSYYCASEDRDITCQNDTQDYVGGPVICCIGKNPCDRCLVRDRWFTLYNYNGLNGQCTPNP